MSAEYPKRYEFAPRKPVQELLPDTLLSLGSFPSRSGILLHAVAQPWLSLPRPISWTVPPLVSLFDLLIFVLDSDCQLVSVDAKSSEVV